MRLTVLDDDPGIKIHPDKRIKVFLDGVEVQRCVTADDEKGEVIILASDENGFMLAVNGEVMYQTLHGIVRIERQD